MKKTSSTKTGELLGTAILGERGQIVIPKEVRAKLKLNKGDTFMVILHGEAVMLVPKKLMTAFIKNLTATLNQ